MRKFLKKVMQPRPGLKSPGLLAALALAVVLGGAATRAVRAASSSSTALLAGATDPAGNGPGPLPAGSSVPVLADPTAPHQQDDQHEPAADHLHSNVADTSDAELPAVRFITQCVTDGSEGLSTRAREKMYFLFEKRRWKNPEALDILTYLANLQAGHEAVLSTTSSRSTSQDRSMFAALREKYHRAANWFEAVRVLRDEFFWTEEQVFDATILPSTGQQSSFAGSSSASTTTWPFNETETREHRKLFVIDQSAPGVEDEIDPAQRGPGEQGREGSFSSSQLHHNVEKENRQKNINTQTNRLLQSLQEIPFFTERNSFSSLKRHPATTYYAVEFLTTRKGGEMGFGPIVPPPTAPNPLVYVEDMGARLAVELRFYKLYVTHNRGSFLFIPAGEDTAVDMRHGLFRTLGLNPLIRARRSADADWAVPRHENRELCERWYVSKEVELPGPDFADAAVQTMQLHDHTLLPWSVKHTAKSALNTLLPRIFSAQEDHRQRPPTRTRLRFPPVGKQIEQNLVLPFQGAAGRLVGSVMNGLRATVWRSPSNGVVPPAPTAWEQVQACPGIGCNILRFYGSGVIAEEDQFWRNMIAKALRQEFHINLGEGARDVEGDPPPGPEYRVEATTRAELLQHASNSVEHRFRRLARDWDLLRRLFPLEQHTRGFFRLPGHGPGAGRRLVVPVPEAAYDGICSLASTCKKRFCPKRRAPAVCRRIAKRVRDDYVHKNCASGVDLGKDKFLVTEWRKIENIANILDDVWRKAPGALKTELRKALGMEAPAHEAGEQEAAPGDPLGKFGSQFFPNHEQITLARARSMVGKNGHLPFLPFMEHPERNQWETQALEIELTSLVLKKTITILVTPFGRRGTRNQAGESFRGLPSGLGAMMQFL
ncbi:unnamed protein product [Amoebophrya sp. A120]|nr:unnamed protein product [Amoebophrya sp. A120]|eukprot:GSA120T00010610001.1